MFTLDESNGVFLCSINAQSIAYVALTVLIRAELMVLMAKNIH